MDGWRGFRAAETSVLARLCCSYGFADGESCCQGDGCQGNLRTRPSGHGPSLARGTAQRSTQRMMGKATRAEGANGGGFILSEQQAC